MGTRGAIARPNGDGWSGRYHHWDSYPTGLGQTLWDAYHGYFAGDVAAMQAYFIDAHPAGWSSVAGADFARLPGYIEYPPSASEDPNGFAAYLAQPKCFCHGDRTEDPSPLIECDGNCSEDTCDPVFIEWAYVLAPTGLDVFSVSDDADNPAGSGFRHVHVGFYPWAGPEPDWGAVQKAGGW